jgi:hypothetical protein
VSNYFAGVKKVNEITESFGKLSERGINIAYTDYYAFNK